MLGSDWRTILEGSLCKPSACAVRTAAPSCAQHSVILRSKVKKRALYGATWLAAATDGPNAKLTRRRVSTISNESFCTATAINRDCRPRQQSVRQPLPRHRGATYLTNSIARTSGASDARRQGYVPVLIWLQWRGQQRGGEESEYRAVERGCRCCRRSRKMPGRMARTSDTLCSFWNDHQQKHGTASFLYLHICEIIVDEDVGQ